MVKLTLPTDSAERKSIPVLSGCLNYAPAALAGMARWSKIGNDKHNPGQPLHHARGKSMDHPDTIVRHLMDIQDLTAALERGDYPAPEHEGILKQLKDDLDALVWRSALLSQEAHERYFGAPLAPGARLPILGGELTFGTLAQSVAAKVPGNTLREADTLNQPQPKRYRRDCPKLAIKGDYEVGCGLTEGHEGACQ